MHSIANRKKKVLLFFKENYFLWNNWLNIFVSTYISPKIKTRNKTFPKILCKGSIVQQSLLYGFLCFRVNYVSKGKIRNHRESYWVPLWATDIKRISTSSERSFAIKKYDSPKRKQEFWQDTGLPAPQWWTVCVLKSRTDTTAFLWGENRKQSSLFTRATILLVKRGLPDSERLSIRIAISTVHVAPSPPPTVLSICLSVKKLTGTLRWSAFCTLWPRLSLHFQAPRRQYGHNQCILEFPDGCTYLRTEPCLES